MSVHRVLLSTVAILTISLSSTISQSAVINVPANQPTIQAGIDAAVDGDTVLVAPGTYEELIDFKGKSICVKSSAGPDSTVLTYPSRINSLVSFVSGEDTLAIFDGFTVSDVQHYYGAVRIDSLCSGTIRNCRFIDNSNPKPGPTSWGVIAIYRANYAIVENSYFEGNQSYGDAGIGMAGGTFRVSNNVFKNNVGFGDYGGAIASGQGGTGVVEGNLFVGNSAPHGGALFISESTDFTVVNNTFVNNSDPSNDGGGICVWYYNSNITIDRNLFVGNSGYAISNVYGSSITADCNDAWLNAPDQYNGDVTPGPNSISADPLFCDTMNAEYTLIASSPCSPDSSLCGALIGAFDVDCPYNGPVWYISATGSDSTGDGSTEMPFATIQRGIDAAINGDTVLIASGTYAGDGNRKIDVQGKSVLITSALGPDSTVVECPYDTAFYFRNNEDTTTILRGITFNSDSVMGVCQVVCSGASPKFIDCRFTNARQYGAVSVSGSEAVFVDCEFVHNGYGCDACKDKTVGAVFGATEAGAINCWSSNLIFMRCSFQGNWGETEDGSGTIGASNSSLTIDSCTFEGDVAWGGWGGAISLSKSTVLIRNSEFNGVSADKGGGVIRADSSSITASDCVFNQNYSTTQFYLYGLGGVLMTTASHVSFQKCKLDGNASLQDGGAIHAVRSSLSMEGCLLLGNISGTFAGVQSWPLTGHGGAIYADSTNIDISNSTIADNSCFGDSVPTFYSEGAAVYLKANCSLTVSNSILAYNTGDEVIVSNDSTSNIINFTCADISGNEYGDWLDGYSDQLGINGNISSPPYFCDPDSGDYSLYDISACAPANNTCSTLIGAVDVACIDVAPTITSPDSIVAFQDSVLVYHISFTEPDGPDTILSATAPAWLTFNADSLYGSPGATDDDTTFEVIVSDGFKADTQSVFVDVKHLYAEVLSFAIDDDTDLSHVISDTPVFSWSYGETYETKSQLQFEIAIGTDTDWAYAEMWNPAPFASSDTSVTYGGSPISDGSTYYGRLRTKNDFGWSEWYNFEFHVNTPPSIPQPLGVDNGVVTDLHPILWLLNSSDAESDSLTYDFAGFHDTDCVAGANIDLTGIPETPDSTGAQMTDSLAEDCHYWWRVRAFDGYEYSDWSDYAHFYYDHQPHSPEEFFCLWPVGDTIVHTLAPTLSWEYSYDPDPYDTVRYRLTISTDSLFQFVDKTDSLLDTTYVVQGSMLHGTHYWWTVRAYDRTGLFFDTPVASFWTWLPGDVDTSHIVDISDLIYMVDYTFGGGPAPVYEQDGDVNGDCTTDVSDLIYLVEYFFNSGPPPTVCGGAEATEVLHRDFNSGALGDTRR